MTLTTRRIVDYLKDHHDEMIHLLMALAELETPSSEPATQIRILEYLQGELAKAGLLTRFIPGKKVGATLLARPARKRRPSAYQLLIGHADTVWPLHTLQKMPVTRDQQVVKGPGVFDMKGGLMQMVFALRAIHDLDLSPPAAATVIINTDEEIGSAESGRIIRKLAAHACRAFILEPAFGSQGKLKTARKGVGRFHIYIYGKAAHAGVNPEEGISAILELSYQIQKLFALNDPARGITVNVGTIDGGLRPNVVAPEVEAVLDVRVPTQEDAERLDNSIRGLKPVNPAAEIRVEGGFGRPPMESTTRNQLLWKLARELGKEELGVELESSFVGGASDGNTTSLFTATLDGLGAVGDGAHALHEHVRIAKISERTALLALLLLAPCRMEIPSGEGKFLDSAHRS